MGQDVHENERGTSESNTHWKEAQFGDIWKEQKQKML